LGGREEVGVWLFVCGVTFLSFSQGGLIVVIEYTPVALSERFDRPTDGTSDSRIVRQTHSLYIGMLGRRGTRWLLFLITG
jgi:hypothetical protein